MCRAGDNFLLYANAHTQFLRITSFYLHFPGHHASTHFPDSLTLVYLPRISEAELDINGTKVRPDSPAFVTLHRVRDDDGIRYGCRDKVRAGAGFRFEVYLGQEKLLKGTFRKDGLVGGRGWEVECRCAMERETAVRDGDVAELHVGVEGGVGGGKIREAVRMAARRMRRGKRDCFRNGLEEIPEESEAEGVSYDDMSTCSCCGGSEGCEAEEDCDGECGWDEVNTEGVKWAVDVGIWVFCLGVGFLVSRASSTSKLGKRRVL